MPPVASSVDAEGHARMSLAVKMADEAHCCPQCRRLCRNAMAPCMVDETLVAFIVDVEDHARIFIGGVENRKHVTAPVLLV